MTLAEVMKKLEPLAQKRFNMECFPNRSVDVVQLVRDEQAVYEEFEAIAKQGRISEKDLHSGFEGISYYGQKLYQIAFNTNQGIFTATTVEELSDILAGWSEWEASYGEYPWDKTSGNQHYEYPFLSLGFVLDLNPSLINEKSFSNLLKALNNHLEAEGAFVFSEFVPPNPLDCFTSLCGDAKKYVSLLIKSRLTPEQLDYLIEGDAIDSRVVMEAEKYLQGDTYETALQILKRVSEVRPEYILLGWRNCIEKAYDLLPFAKEVPTQNFLALGKNVARYGFSSVAISLAIGEREISELQLKELKRLEECVKGCKPEVGYYFAAALLDKRLAASSVERFAAAVKSYFSVKALSSADTSFCEYMPMLSQLDDERLEKFSWVIEHSKTQSSNMFKVPERDRLRSLLLRLEDVVNAEQGILNQRLWWLNCFESTKGDIDPDAYAGLILSGSDSFVALWERMQKDMLYEFHIEDGELTGEISAFRDRYLATEKGPIDYSEKARIFRLLMSQFEHGSREKDISVIAHVGAVVGIDPYSASQETIKQAYRSLARQHHPDRTGTGDERFKLIKDSEELLLHFVEYRDKKWRQRFGTLLPVIV